MRALVWFVIIISAVAVVLGVRLAGDLKRLAGGGGAACEVRTFDHVTYLRLIREEAELTASHIADLRKASPGPVRAKAIVFFDAKLAALRAAGLLVEAQIASGGAQYACVDPGYGMLMYGLDFPSFAKMSREDEVKAMLDHFGAVGQTSATQLLAIMLAPAVALLLGLLTLYGPRKEAKSLNSDRTPP